MYMISYCVKSNLQIMVFSTSMQNEGGSQTKLRTGRLKGRDRSLEPGGMHLPTFKERVPPSLPSQVKALHVGG